MAKYPGTFRLEVCRPPHAYRSRIFVARRARRIPGTCLENGGQRRG